MCVDTSGIEMGDGKMKWRNLESLPNKKQTVLVLLEFPFPHKEDFVSKKAIWFADYTPAVEHEKWTQDGRFTLHLGIDSEPFMRIESFTAKHAGLRGWMPFEIPEEDE